MTDFTESELAALEQMAFDDLFEASYKLRNTSSFNDHRRMREDEYKEKLKAFLVVCAARGHLADPDIMNAMPMEQRLKFLTASE